MNAEDLYLFDEGTHYRLYEKLGAHPATVDGTAGAHFAVWAPRAGNVFVMGEFNRWDEWSHPLARAGGSGIWEGSIPGVAVGTLYKYHIVSRQVFRVDKADPFAFRTETPPGTASVLWHLDYQWGDAEWMAARRLRNSREEPVSVYEVHPGSWRRVPEEGGRPLCYRELAEQLADYATQMGYTHVEFLPVMEHPFYGSWGYQVAAFFAPTARYGTPQDFMEVVDTLHRHGIGVVLDWVPSHFAADRHGLIRFDGEALFEPSDAGEASQSEWNSCLFDYGRPQVRSFLVSSALFWLDKYHADGLRVDGVASMLWADSTHTRQNTAAAAFLRQLNEAVHRYFPAVDIIAEDSSAFPDVSRPAAQGGLGFGFKWDMGWMHDTLEYFSAPPPARGRRQRNLTFRSVYAFNENYLLPLSHDEVKPPFGSLLAKMPGDDWQKFANLRLLLSYLYAAPGKKLLFMGGEFGQWREWDHESSLDWHLVHDARHAGLSSLAGTLNWLYKSEPALHELDCEAAGFEWIDGDDAERSVISFLRKGRSPESLVLVVCHFTPTPLFNYRVGAPDSGWWREVLNSDSVSYGGAGYGNLGGVEAAPIPWNGRRHSLNLTLPPLGALFFKR